VCSFVPAGVPVWGLVRHTLVAVSLDINTDSNTRQRDLCHTDAFITTLGQLALSNDYGGFNSQRVVRTSLFDRLIVRSIRA
jgi:hypothetical protein